MHSLAHPVQQVLNLVAAAASYSGDAPRGSEVMKILLTCRVAFWASASLFALAASVMKPFWKMYCFRMEASTICSSRRVMSAWLY